MEAVPIAEKQAYASARHTPSRTVSDGMMRKFMEQMAAECPHFVRPDSDFDPSLEPRTLLSKTMFQRSSSWPTGSSISAFQTLRSDNCER